VHPLAFERVEIDGVPAYIGNNTGPVVAGLAFRVGTVDEAPFERGLTAVVAELAAIDVDTVEFDAGMTVTSFVARGSADEVSDALAAVCRALPAFTDDDFTQLAGTILDESPQAPALLSTLLSLRFGAHDFGTATLPPLGLLRADGEAARAWTARFFNRSNAALWSTGPLAATASLALPAGERSAPPSRPETECPAPAWCPNAWLGTIFHDAIDCTMLAPMSDATLVALRALQDEIVERLADTALAGRRPDIHLARWSEDLGYVTLSLDTLASGNEGVEVVLGSLDDFAELGPDPDELAGAVTEIWRWSTEHDNAEPVAEMLAADELRTRRPRLLDAFLESIDAVTAAEVQDVFTELRETIVLAIPSDADIVDPEMTLLERTDGMTVDGKQYRRAETTGTPADDARLFIGADGVTLSTADQQLTIYYEDCVAAVAYPDESIALYDVDGTMIEFAAADWRDGDKAHAAVVAAVAPDDMLVAERTLGTQVEPSTIDEDIDADADEDEDADADEDENDAEV
jgi:zinc protease